MLPLALLLGAAPVCAELEANLARAKTPEYLVVLDDAKTQLGLPLLHPSETELDKKEQQRLTAARLRTACTLHASTPPQTFSGDAAKLKEILDRPEFSRARDRNPQAVYQWLRSAMEWLEELLGQKPAQAFASGVRLLVLLLAIAVAALVTVRLFRRRWPSKDTRLNVPAAEPLVLLDPALHVQRARQKAPAEPREALREGLLALLSELERRKLARPDRVKTNRELAKELPARGAEPELSARVTELLKGYDRTWYSLEPVDAETALQFVDRVEALRGALEAPR